MRRVTLGLLAWGLLLSAALAAGACSAGSAESGSAGGLLPGSTAGGKPVGLFFFVSSSDFTNQRVYYFTPTGQVYKDPTDFSAALAALAPAQRGSYAVSGKQMTIKWANGSTTTGNYHADPSGFSCEGSFMCVAPFASPRQLAGTFDGQNAAVTVDANSLALFRTLALKADGTFTRDTYAASHSEVRHADNSGLATDAASSGPQQAGHWKLDGWYLTLTDAQGHTARDIAYPVGTDSKVTLFHFNGIAYERK